MSPVLLASEAGPLAMFISQVLAFVIAAFVLGKFVVPFLKKILDKRSEEIKSTFETFERETAEASKELTDFTAKLADVAQEADRHRKEALAQAEKTRDQALVDAQQQAQATLDRARRDIQIERDKAVLELRQEAENLTLQAADHLVQSAMNEQIDQKLVDTYLNKFDSVNPS